MSADAPFSDEALRPLLEHLAEDVRVLGVARMQSRPTPTPDELHVLVVTTWDGLNPIGGTLPALADRVIPAEHVLLDDLREPRPIELEPGPRLWRYDRDGRQLVIEVIRIADLKPSFRGEHARALVDPQGALTQWIEWSRGRKQAEVDDAALHRDALRRASITAIEYRALRTLPPGTQMANDDLRSLRHSVAERLRRRSARLPDGEPYDRLRQLVETATAGVPLASDGVRELTPGVEGFERFVTAADGEGFRGDRPLFAAAVEALRGAQSAEPVFEEGFALPTFDQVEARFALGEAVGGCKPPLVPSVVVGVAVTENDELAFWSAPALHPPHATVACVADPGDRVTLLRTAGKDALFGACEDSAAAAAEALPDLLRRARSAHQERLDEPEAALRPLHLPRSYVVAVERLGGLDAGRTRLELALTLARAGEDMSPIVARHMGRAAGRLLLAAEPAADDGCAGEG